MLTKKEREKRNKERLEYDQKRARERIAGHIRRIIQIQKENRRKRELEAIADMPF